MPKLKVSLAASLIDVERDGVHFVAADVSVLNSTSAITVENLGGTPRSVLRFSTSHPALFGIHASYTPYVEQGAMIFAMACTLTNRRVLFGPVNPVYLDAHYEHDPIPHIVEPVDGQPGRTRKMITIPTSAAIAFQYEESVQLDEVLVLDIGAQLAALGIFTTSLDDELQAKNTREAAKSYFEAIRAPSIVQSYSSMYQCLEKSVNADGGDRTGPRFDKHAAAIVKAHEADLEQLREFRNRVEHIIRHQKDWKTLRQGEAKLGELAIRLKLAADTALRSNLSCLAGS